MATTEKIPQRISIKAGSLLNTINRGLLNLHEIKDFLAQVEAISSPRKRNKRTDRREQVKTLLK
jgi:hypothetical protein